MTVETNFDVICLDGVETKGNIRLWLTKNGGYALYIQVDQNPIMEFLMDRTGNSAGYSITLDDGQSEHALVQTYVAQRDGEVFCGLNVEQTGVAMTPPKEGAPIAFRCDGELISITRLRMREVEQLDLAA